MKGVYIVFFEMESKETVEIGALGEITFEKGFYAYIGSAMNSLESRVQRHFAGEKDNTHWHIDYFSAVAEPIGFAAFAVESKWECIFSKVSAANCKPVKGFGSSDCGCEAHLYRL